MEMDCSKNTKKPNKTMVMIMNIFQDQANSTALPVLHLIDAMREGTIDYSVVKEGTSEEVSCYYSLHNGWPNSCSLKREGGPTVRPSIVLKTVFETKTIVKYN